MCRATGGVVYISSEDLSVAFGLSSLTLRRWPVEDQPPRLKNRMHRFSDINAWLATRTYGFAKPPTIEQILSGEITFVLREEASRLLTAGTTIKHPRMYTLARIQNGKLEALRLRQYVWIISVRSINRVIQQRAARQDGFSAADLKKIFGISGGSLERLWASDKLTYITDPEHNNYRRATYESVKSLVASLLSQVGSSIDPDDWIDDCLHATEPLITVPQVARRLAITEDNVRLLLTSGVLSFIPGPGDSKWFVPGDRVTYYMQHAKPLPLADQAKVFGVTEKALRALYRNGSIRCPLHDHKPSYALHRWCLLAYLEPRMGPGVSAMRWLAMAFAHRSVTFWAERTATQQTGVKAEQLRAAADAGRIPMITGPAGRPVYVALAVKREAKRLR